MKPVTGATLFRHRDHFAAAKVLAGQRTGGILDLFNVSRGHQFAPVLTGPGAHVGDEVRRPHHRLVVLHHQHRVAHIAQIAEGVDEPVVVVGMEAHRRLVADVKDAGKARAYLGGQPYPLGLATGQGAGSPVQRHVVQPDALEELEPSFDFFKNLVADGLLAGGERLPRLAPRHVRVYFHHPFQGSTDVLGGNFHDAGAAYPYRQSLRAQPPAAAAATGPRRHVALYFLAGVVRLGLLVPPLQVGDDPLEGGVPLVFAAAVGLVADRHFLGAVAVEDKVHLLLGQVLDRDLG